MTALCRHTTRHLGAFVDGELANDLRHKVARHLAECDECQVEVAAIRELGEHVRAGARHLAPDALEGLAGRVVGQVRAERQQSWRVMFERAIDDWRWALVGAGSMGAALVSVFLVAILVSAGPVPPREDSLAELLNNLGGSAGTLVIVATPVGQDSGSVLMQFNDGATRNASASTMANLPSGFSDPSGSDLVFALSETVVSRDGRVVELARDVRQDPRARRVAAEPDRSGRRRAHRHLARPAVRRSAGRPRGPRPRHRKGTLSAAARAVTS